MPSLPGKISFKNATAKAITAPRHSNTAQAAAIRIRNSQRWKDCRLLKLQESPLCENPVSLHDGELVPARQVHHLQELVAAPHLAFVMANLQSVCTRCHAALSARERA
jgi:5-methylcytosine-specific restriction endonuclease McrA